MREMWQEEGKSERESGRVRERNEKEREAIERGKGRSYKKGARERGRRRGKEGDREYELEIDKYEERRLKKVELRAGET
jgi:hypothetical protein